MKYLTFPKPWRLFYSASHSFSGRVLKANCSGPISGNIIRTVVQARMRDRSTTKILSGSRRMTIAYHSWCFLFLTHLTFRLRLSPTGDEITAEKRENDDPLKELLSQCFFLVPQPLGSHEFCSPIHLVDGVRLTNRTVDDVAARLRLVSRRPGAGCQFAYSTDREVSQARQYRTK